MPGAERKHMHSRIFQISKNPIDEDDYIDADYYCDEGWFVNAIADYVADVDDRDAELDEWLSRFNGRGLEYDSEKKTLTIIDRERRFAGKYAEFRWMLEKLADATLILKGGYKILTRDEILAIFRESL